MIHPSLPSFLLPLSLHSMLSNKPLNNDTFVYMKSNFRWFGLKWLTISLMKLPSVCVCVFHSFVGIYFRGYSFILTWTAIIFSSYSQYSSLDDGKYHNQSSKSHLPIGTFSIISFAWQQHLTGKAAINFKFMFLINFPEYEQYKGCELFVLTKLDTRTAFILWPCLNSSLQHLT